MQEVDETNSTYCTYCCLLILSSFKKFLSYPYRRDWNFLVEMFEAFNWNFQRGGVPSMGVWTFPETTQFYFQTYFNNQGVWPNIAMIDWPHSPGYQLHQKGIPPLVPSSLQPFHDLQGPGWRIRMSVSDTSWPPNKLSS